MTLVYSAKDVEHNQAVAISEVLGSRRNAPSRKSALGDRPTFPGTVQSRFLRGPQVNNTRSALDQRPHVVIVGGGFGGTHAAHTLRNAPVSVTVIDRTNHSIFHPLLYQVASAGLSSDEIAVPIRFMLRRQRNSDVMMAEVIAVDVQQRRVQMGARQLSYDYLVLATGSHYNYFGHDDWPRFAFELEDDRGRSAHSAQNPAGVRASGIGNGSRPRPGAPDFRDDWSWTHWC